MKIKVQAQPNGECFAIDEDSYDGYGSPTGWGENAAEAIEDLKEQLIERKFYTVEQMWV